MSSLRFDITALSHAATVPRVTFEGEPRHRHWLASLAPFTWGTKMSSAGILEVLVLERAQSTQEATEPAVLKSELRIAAEKDEESHTRTLVIGAFILGATMLGGMASTLLLWAWLR